MINAHINGPVSLINKAAELLESIDKLKLDHEGLDIHIRVNLPLTSSHLSSNSVVKPVASPVVDDGVTSITKVTKIKAKKAKKVSKVDVHEGEVKQIKKVSHKQNSKPDVKQPKVLKEDVHKALQEVNTEKGLPAARGVLEKFSVARISELYNTPNVWPHFIESCKELLA